MPEAWYRQSRSVHPESIAFRVVGNYHPLLLATIEDFASAIVWVREGSASQLQRGVSPVESTGYIPVVIGWLTPLRTHTIAEAKSSIVASSNGW